MGQFQELVTSALVVFQEALRSRFNELDEFIAAGRDGQGRTVPGIRSTSVYRVDGGGIAVRYHFTNVVMLTPTSLVLNSGGYKTATTKARINEFAPDGVSVYQKDWTWYLSINVEGQRNEWVFRDGITITSDLQVHGAGTL